MEPIIEVKHLKKSFGDLEVLHDIDFTVSKGEVVTIIGASGSGKSTFLRCLNILETPNGGSVMYHGKDILKGEIYVNVHRSKVGMVFQSFNLFNNKSVLENCVIGQMKVLKRNREEATKIAMRYLKKVGMERFAKAGSMQLSGGQKQRVALARLLVYDTNLVLLDEPFSALDESLKEILLNETKKKLIEYQKKCLFVTHSPKEMKMMCDNKLKIKRGRLE